MTAPTAPTAPTAEPAVDPAAEEPIAPAVRQPLLAAWRAQRQASGKPGVVRSSALIAVERASRSGPLTWPTGYLADRCRAYGEATLWYGRAAGCKPAAALSAGG